MATSMLASRSCVSRAVRVNVSRPRPCSSRRMVVLVRAEANEAPEPPKHISNDVIKIIAKQLAVEDDKVTHASKFVDLGADSLDTVEIMMALEEKFDITLSEDGAEKIATVGDAARLIHATIEAKDS